jgi:hypothetical protein
MIRLPTAFSLILCAKIKSIPTEKGVDLQDVFHAFYLLRFPSSPPHFTVYTALFDGVGEGTMELAVWRLETEEDLYFNRRWVAFPGRGYVVNFELLVKRLILPAPGRYGFSLRFDKREITSRIVEAHRI